MCSSSENRRCQNTYFPCGHRLSLLFVLVFVFCLDQVTGGSKSLNGPCPTKCRCYGVSIDCSNRDLFQVPKNLPKNVERLNLKDNHITVIRDRDFKGLFKLRVLQLLDNKIEVIEFSAFHHLTSLERLRLNRNRIRKLPEDLFVHTPKLHRLDLSTNQLEVINKNQFKGAPRLKNLQMDDNRISCISKESVQNLLYLKILTLNKNNLTTLPKNIFIRMANLRTLRLSENPFNCDCRLTWLSYWLRTKPNLGLNTRCAEPQVLYRRNVADLSSDDFQCSVADVNKLNQECSTMPNFICPGNCKCIDQTVDCSGLRLMEIPKDLPSTTTELSLSRNWLVEIPANAFAKMHSLRRLDLSMNRIVYLHHKAFAGLGNLNSLLLYKNRIKVLPRGVFHGLRRLQVMLINTNNISCLPIDTFRDLGQLNFVSMYENNIQAIANGTFTPLKKIYTLHLGRNPLICDCNLLWIKDYFKRIGFQPQFSYGPKCHSPPRLKLMRIVRIPANEFRCTASQRMATQGAGSCNLFIGCPKRCRCEGSQMDCSGIGLKSMPDNIPTYVTHLYMRYNEIEYIAADGIVSKMKNLQILDLKRNRIRRIAPGAFKNNPKLQELDLSENFLSHIEANQLEGLENLKSLRLAVNRISCINNDTFSSLKNLHELALGENKLKCIMQGSFSQLRTLQALRIDQNSFHCNCHLNWMPEFIRKRPGLFQGSYPLCSSPPLLSETMMGSLQKRNFKCESFRKKGCNYGIVPCCTKDAVSCDTSHYCPPKCKCEGNDRSIVRCNRIKLKDIPKDIPLSTTELYLSGNEISEVNTTILEKLQHLTTLDLSLNRIRGLGPNVFASLKNLKTLHLGYNKLQCIDQRSFAGLKKLKALILQGNDVSTIPFGSFDDLISLNNVGLGQNPFYCDCNIKWMKEFFNRHFLDNGISTCSGPPTMQHKSIYHSKAVDFVCPETKSGAVYPKDTSHLEAIQKCSPCASSPCQNNGNCTARGYFDFECVCKPGFHGKQCANQIDACFGEPCANGAVCKVVDNYGRFSCKCRPGFVGSRCHINIDNCANHTCQNNATCEDGINDYKCACRPGFRGKFCEKKIHYCEDINPCKNAKQCIPLDNDYQCVCKPGWEGKDCNENIDDCVVNNCQHRGRCIDEVQGYTCKCRPGYVGKYCEKYVVFMNFDPYPNRETICSQHRCQNGGRCQEEPKFRSMNRGVEYKCLCPPGFGGKFCEYLTTVSFQKDSFFEQKAPNFLRSVNITMNIATHSSDGIILYHGGKNSHFLIVNLLKGHLHLAYSLGIPPGVEGYSTVRINDGKFHTFELNIFGENVTMKVDGVFQSRLMTQFDQDTNSLNSSKPIYIGGGPVHLLRIAKDRSRLQKTYGFAGCIKEAFMNKHIINFGALDRAQKIHAGCQRFLKPANPCRAQKCRNGGHCRLVPGPSRFKCDCRRGYTGRYCEKASSCRRTTRLEYYIDPETSCRSRKRLKIRSCRGGCSARRGYCCKPRRYKNRRVKFRCPSGRRYERRIKLIRKCGCKAC